MSEDIVIRSYRPGDEEQMLQLLDTVFRGWPHLDLMCSSLDHWNWKFKDNPSGKNNIALGIVGEKIVACNHGFFTNTKFGDRVMLSRQGVDAATHPDYRGRGLYSKTDKLKDELDILNKVEMTYSFTTNPIFLKKRVKDKRPKYYSPMVRLLRVENVDQHIKNMPDTTYLKKVFIKYSLHLLSLFNYVINIFQVKVMPSKTIQVADIDKFDGQFDVFFDKINENYKFITERTSNYLNWRYCDSRGGNYIIKRATENLEIIGYVVLRINKYDINEPVGNVVDLCTISNRLDCAVRLIEESLELFRKNKVNILQYRIVKDHPYEKLFKQFGFFDAMRNIDISFDLYKDGVKIFENIDFKPDKVLFQLGDTDWI